MQIEITGEQNKAVVEQVEMIFLVGFLYFSVTTTMISSGFSPLKEDFADAFGVSGTTGSTPTACPRESTLNLCSLRRTPRAPHRPRGPQVRPDAADTRGGFPWSSLCRFSRPASRSPWSYPHILLRASPREQPTVARVGGGRGGPRLPEPCAHPTCLL